MPAEAVSRVTLQEIRMYQSHELHRVKLLMPALCRIRQGRKVVSWEGHTDIASNNQIILFPSGYELGIANYPDDGFYLAEMLYLPVELIHRFRQFYPLTTRETSTPGFCTRQNDELIYCWDQLKTAVQLKVSDQLLEHMAMGTTIFLCGSHVYSLDNVLLKKKPHLADSRVFRLYCGSLPMSLSAGGYKKLALWLLAFVVVFDVGTYSYYRRSVVTPYHHGPVSPTTHHIALSEGQLLGNGLVSVHAYLNAGTPEAPEHIMEAWIKDARGNTVVHWDTAMLSSLPAGNFKNDYAYNQFESGRYGIQAIVGSAVVLTQQAGELKGGLDRLPDEPLTLVLIDMEGHTFSTPLSSVYY